MQKLTQLKSSEIKEVRNKILNDQDGICALCNEVITEKTGITLDHQHKFKKDEIGVDGAGLIRGVLCRNCNLLEGKFWNNSNRFLRKSNETRKEDKIEFLQSLIEYYERDTYPLIHPTEKVKELDVSKKYYNVLKKEYFLTGRKKKFPIYPKSKKMTKDLRVLFEEFGISMYN